MAFDYHVMVQSSSAAAVSEVDATRYLLTIQWTSVAMLWYDYMLTFGSEVRYIWGKRFRISTVLYVFCRYPLIGNVLHLFVIANDLGNSCTTWLKTIGTLALFALFAVLVTITARTYALCNGNRYVLIYLCALGLGSIILSLTTLTKSCMWPALNAMEVLVHRFDQLLGPLMCIFEFSSTLITFARYIQTSREFRGTSFRARHFFLSLLEQGVLYFVYTASLSVTSVILNYHAPPGSFLQRYLNALVLPMSCVLTARFLLHLRKVEERLEKGGAGAFGDQEHVGLGSFLSNPTHMSSIVADFGVDANIYEQMSRHVSAPSPAS